MQLNERINGLSARVSLLPFSRGTVAIAFCVDVPGCRPAMAEPLIMKECAEGIELQPAVTLEPLAVQQLMDDLWRCGFRPSEGTGSAGQLASVKYHLEDMRKLVFEKRP